MGSLCCGWTITGWRQIYSLYNRNSDEKTRLFVNTCDCEHASFYTKSNQRSELAAEHQRAAATTCFYWRFTVTWIFDHFCWPSLVCFAVSHFHRHNVLYTNIHQASIHQLQECACTAAKQYWQALMSNPRTTANASMSKASDGMK